MDTNLPHVMIDWGPSDVSRVNMLRLYHITATAATCSLCDLEFGLRIIASYPHVCMNIFDCGNGGQGSLRLAGIVGSERDLVQMRKRFLLSLRLPHATTERMGVVTLTSLRV